MRPKNCVGQLIELAASAGFIFRLVCFVMFAVAYAQEAQDCLDDDYRVFDVAFDDLTADFLTNLKLKIFI